MIETLIGSIIGFVSSFIPSLIDIYKAKIDNKQELDIIDRQIERDKLGHKNRLEEVLIEANSRETVALYKHDAPIGVKFIDGLSKTVRPVITYCFFLLFAGVKCAEVVFLLNNDMGYDIILQEVWDPETTAMFSAIVSFWFGNRSIEKRGRAW